MFWKKKKQPESKILLGMVMLHSADSFHPQNFLRDLKEHSQYEAVNVTGDAEALIFGVENEPIAIGTMRMPVPAEEIEGTAQYAYNWPTAVADLENHSSHLIVSVLAGSSNQVKRFRIFTSVISSLLRTTDAVGVYKGSQSILVPKQEYIIMADEMSDDWFPLNLWIYFGLRVNVNGTSGYTYGLQEFNKRELEIVNSDKSPDDVRELLFNMTHYLLEQDIEFKDGETCGLSEDERIQISLSKGKLVDGQTFKLNY